MHGYIRTREISIEEDEGGFVLVIENDGDRLTVNIQDVAETLYDQARSRIGPWLRERDEARYRSRVFACDPDESGGVAEEYVVAVREDGSYRVEPDEDAYDPTDPKHPRYHSTHADLWDAREGK